VPANLPLIPGDAVLLEQVLINLLENACKYSTGEIEINASATPREVAVVVNDRGLGIAPGEEEHVFQKFHRSDRDGAREGVGLGLTICRAIVTVHGGAIAARNRDGGGASFRFTLPLDATQPSTPPTEDNGASTEERSP
jgi:two-component system sensor histidine kinase KdpD